MSRSIHTTRRHLEEARRWQVSDSQRHQRLLDTLEEEFSTKQRAKRSVSRERSTPAEPLPPTHTEFVPIVVRDAGQYIHYPASVDDIRNVMRVLPRGVLDGISDVELSLGADRQDTDRNRYRDSEDPHTGRLGVEVLPGVFSGRCQAVYTIGDHRIRLFSYVYDLTLPDREMWECYLRLHMLSSFVHEVAHHYDSTMRVARGRWRMDEHDKVEGYAEGIQRDWMRDCVIPYVERTYPGEVKALTSWVEHHGGVAMPLSMLAGDSRAPWNDGVVSAVGAFFDVPSAIGHLAQDVYQGKALAQTRLEFARSLHYGEHYEPALRIIARVLKDTADDLDGLALKADILVHQDQHTEAQTLVDRVLARDPNHRDALWVRIDICENARDWRGLLDTSAHMLRALHLEFWDGVRATLHQARAHLELGDYVAMNADLEAVEQRDWGSSGIPRFKRREIDELRAAAQKRSQEP